jgi:hypothetical protein
MGDRSVRPPPGAPKPIKASQPWFIQFEKCVGNNHANLADLLPI